MAVRRTGRRRLTLVAGVFLALIGLFASSSPSYAEPDTDDEGGTLTLREQLEKSAKDYYDAKARLTDSRKQQKEISAKLRESELSLARLTAEVSAIATGRYQGAQLNVLSGLFTGEGDPTELLAGAALSDFLVWRDDEYLRQYRSARDEAQVLQNLLDTQVEREAKALKDLDQQKRDAEAALAKAGGMVSSGYEGPVPEAQPAPRNADGSWPWESCTINDPTSGGCLTPRMFHALNEARLAGFTRYVHCWRTQSWGEHPKGRACDFSAQQSGFGSTNATGDDKAYGERLAAWAKKNADALGVMYVIWYRQIWSPGVGWRSYFGCCDASSMHTNHVHISIL